MFGLGWVEIVIVLGLGYLALRHIVARRYPGIYRVLNVLFFLTVALMLVFGLLARLH